MNGIFEICPNPYLVFLILSCPLTGGKRFC
jgi:hypothetical protein